MSPADDRKEMDEQPVGQRPQDVRSRTETIVERDAKHLSDEIPGTTTDVAPADREFDRDDAVGASGVNQESRKIKAMTPDGKPYADSMDPDSRDDGVSNVGAENMP